MVAAAFILAAGLAYWLSRRVSALVHTTNALIRGDYAVRLKDGTKLSVSRARREELERRLGVEE